MIVNLDSGLCCGHDPVVVALAILMPPGHFVSMSDFLYEHHGLGDRYARVQVAEYPKEGKTLAYAYLDLPGTTYDVITSHDTARDLGSFEDLTADAALTDRVTVTWISRLDVMPTPQQLALALIRIKGDRVQADDELGLHRAVKWASDYERRAHWINTHRHEAFELARIDWNSFRF